MCALNKTAIPQWYKNNKTRHVKSWLTRRSENNNTPQPLDQWTNSPFTDQQVGNCKSFPLTHYLADLFDMHRGPRSIPLCIQHHIQHTSLSFQVSRPSHSWDTAISIFHLENLRSRSWVRWTLKVTTWVQHSIHSHPSHSGDKTFSKFDFENPRSRSWVRWTLKVTTWVQQSIDAHPFNSRSIGYPIAEIRSFSNLTLKIQGQGQGQSWKS